MYVNVTPTLDLLLNTNQRRFDPDRVENGHFYFSVKKEEVFIYWVYLDIFCEDFVIGFDSH